MNGFYRENPGLLRPDDAFAPWYIHSVFRLPPQEALSSASDGNYDGGIDGFVLENKSGYKPSLTLIQAKFSEESTYVRSGLEGLAKGIRTLEQILITGDTGQPIENRVLSSLRRQLYGLTPEQRSELLVKCLLIHLIRDHEAWGAATATIRTKQEFFRSVGKTTLAGRVTLQVAGPHELDSSEVVPKPALPIPISFEGASHELEKGDKVFLGLGKLSDLVQLHEIYRMDIFSKNVRMYLSRQASKPQSAAYNIKLSLQEICDGERSPSHFALVHNGVTIAVPSVSSPNNGYITLEPLQEGVFILNGCQTVYTAWEFFKNQVAKRKSEDWRERWNHIQIPIRLIATERAERIRDAAIGSNRQTSIPPAALWAHEESQLALESKLARIGIFYERQEGAWEQLERSGSQRVKGFANGVLYMTDVAQVIGAADRTLSLTLAKSPQRIFETKENYSKIFSEDHLSSARFLVFLTNLWEASRLALKDVKDNAKFKFAEMKPGAYIHPIFRLLAHYIVKNEQELVKENCRTLSYRPNTSTPLRRKVFSLMDSSHTNLRQHLYDFWFWEDRWQDPCDAETVKALLGKLRTDTVRVFDGWDYLDREEGQIS